MIHGVLHWAMSCPLDGLGLLLALLPFVQFVAGWEDCRPACLQHSNGWSQCTWEGRHLGLASLLFLD